MIETKVTINGKTPTQFVKEVKKSIATGKKQNLKVRNDVLRLFSDFIASRGPFKDASGSTKFETPSAAPDMQGSLASFEKFFGTSVTPTKVFGGAQAYTEIKQRVSAKTSTTITSIQLTGEELTGFEQQYGLKAKTKEVGFSYEGTSIKDIPKEALLAYIKSQPTLMNTILVRARQKFENVLYINYLDKRHNTAPKITLLKDANKVLKLDSIDSPYLDITARVVSLTTRPAIRLQIGLSAAGEKQLKAGDDITIKFHESLGKYVAQRFVQYAIDRKLGTVSDFSEYIRECITLANEFADSSHTPIEYTSDRIDTSKYYTQSINLAGAATKQKSKNKQAFISNIQWTMLTQKRLGESMKRVGEPEPPNIKERSGRFRASVEVTANYRSNLISYTYNPLYRGLEHYGYHPELQVERAIKEVAQQLYNRHFIITRAGSLA